jgi:hypothetical protein
MPMHRRWPRLVYLTAAMLLVQLVLVGGHVHFPGTRSDTAETVHLFSGVSEKTPNGPTHGADQFCALCWAQAAVNSLLVPSPIEFRLPSKVFVSQFGAALRDLAESLALTAFNARAPPAFQEI